MKRLVAGAAALFLLPIAAQAQQQAVPGFYIGAEGGLNWLLNNGGNSYDTGWAVGGKAGYDFVGPRVELEGMYRANNGNGPGITNQVFGKINQISAMANVLYDFFPGGTITPYIGAGAGIAFVDSALATPCSMCNTEFAYQGIVGVSYNISPSLRLDLDGRYYGTTNPNAFQNNNISVILGLTYKFGQPEEAAAAPPPAAPAPQATSFLVFFDWDRSDLSAQALSTINQAAQAFKSKGSARITATGHTDRSGPDSYNMALSLRRANAVKDALVRDGVPATSISVVGKGETQPLVPTADGVREPQNRRVEIVLQ